GRLETRQLWLLTIPAWPPAGKTIWTKAGEPKRSEPPIHSPVIGEPGAWAYTEWQTEKQTQAPAAMMDDRYISDPRQCLKGHPFGLPLPVVAFPICAPVPHLNRPRIRRPGDSHKDQLPLGGKNLLLVEAAEVSFDAGIGAADGLQQCLAQGGIDLAH